MNKLKLSLALIAACAFTGCAGYGNITKNLAKDGAIVRADVGSPWGKQTIVRIGGTTNRVKIGKDGEIEINSK